MSVIVPNPAPRKSVPRIKDEIDYYKHQADGIRRMLRMSSCLLADEMGLGKCIQSLTVAACALDTVWCKRVLCIVPASLKGNWQEEIDSYGRNYTCTVLEGEREQRNKVIQNVSTDILIVNYEQVVKHVEQLNQVGFDLMIYDEAHYLKNRKSARTRACFRLVSPRHFLLTGSPVLNQVDDLWALLHRVAPGEFPSYWTFINRYAVYGGYQNKQIVGIKNEKELRARIAPFVVRREKKDCLDLPDKIIAQERLDMHPDQRKLYDEVADTMELPDPQGADAFTIQNSLVKLLKLKQICVSPAMVDHPDVSPKLDRAAEICRQNVKQGKSIVVFTQFRKAQLLLSERLTKLKIPYDYLHGDVPINQRQQVVNRWTRDTDKRNPSVLICMWQVAGVGLNLTAASTCIAVDKLWVPKLNEQGYDRLHRIGQKNTVTIIELLMRKSVESRIEAVLKRKEGVFGAVLDQDNSDWKRKLIEAVKFDKEAD